MSCQRFDIKDLFFCKETDFCCIKFRCKYKEGFRNIKVMYVYDPL